MRPAKLHMGAAALIVAPVLAALALVPAAQRTSGGPESPAAQTSAGLAGTGLVTAAEAREAPAPQAPVSVAAAPAETEKRTVRVVLDSPFGPPPDVVVTTEPAKPPVYAPEPGKSRARVADAAPEPQEKPKAKKKKPRRAPGLEQFAGPALSSPFFAFTR